MFKNMKLGTKMGFGFGILIAIACFLGGLAIYNMSSVTAESEKLANEYVPEVRLANNVERSALQSTCDIRSFGLSGEKHYLKTGMSLLDETDKWITECRKLADNSEHLVKLKDAVKTSTKNAAQYRKIVDAVVESHEAMNRQREQLDKNAAAYMSACAGFLDAQNAAFKTDLASRQEKVRLVTTISKIGATARVLNFKGQAEKDRKLIEEAISQLDQLPPLFDSLTKLSVDEEDIQRISKTKSAAEEYKAAIGEYLAQFGGGTGTNDARLERIRKRMDTAAGAYVGMCCEYLAGQQEKLATDMRERHDKISLVNDIIDLGNATRVACFKAQALRDPALIEQARSNFAAMDEKFAALRKITRDPADIALIDKTKTAASGYGKAMQAFLGNWNTMQDLDKQLQAAARSVMSDAERTSEAGIAQAEDIAKGASSLLATSSNVMIGGLIVAVIVGVIVAVFITLSTTRPISRIIASLNAGADQTTSAAGQVSAASQSLAQGASEQAASLEETTASMEEMSSMTSQNSDNANQAKQLAGSALGSSERGTEAMSRMSTAIDEIKQSADETAKIVNTINEIAFQTNLLALNAAVEAARAGEAGKGFAVVAEEVRNLAQRSAEAARTTADMIEGSVRNADNGVDISKEVAEALGEIADGSRKVNDLVAEIDAASSEQAQGIGQINTAMTQMDQVTQSNAASAEESASAAEELSAQAEELRRMVGDLQAIVGGSGSRQSSTAGSLRSEKPKPEAHRYAATPAKASGDRPAAREEDWLTADPDKELANF